MTVSWYETMMGRFSLSMSAMSERTYASRSLLGSVVSISIFRDAFISTSFASDSIIGKSMARMSSSKIKLYSPPEYGLFARYSTDFAYSAATSRSFF